MTEHIVIGNLGEVGQAIQHVFEADGIDLGSNIVNRWGTQRDPRRYKYMHVCIPWQNDFGGILSKYAEVFQPNYTIVHSTVPIGTCKQINVTHSPIRGLHPNLYEGIMTFHKFVGGKDAEVVGDVFRRCGLKVIIVEDSNTTELGKLLDTEYYRVCIEFAQRAKKLSYKYEVPFHEAYTLFNTTYNEGYKKLDHDEYVRPVLQAILQPIGGHCVLNNQSLLGNEEYHECEECGHRTISSK